MACTRFHPCVLIKTCHEGLCLFWEDKGNQLLDFLSGGNDSFSAYVAIILTARCLLEAEESMEAISEHKLVGFLVVLLLC